jgi:hypothetical protein
MFAKENYSWRTLDGDNKKLLYKIKADFSKTVYAYTKTSIGMFEAFISCWDEKYRVLFALRR